MSNENWERKFDKVVRETEKNIAKAKNGLQHSSPQGGVVMNISTERTPKRTDNLATNYLSHKKTRDQTVVSEREHRPHIMKYQKNLWSQSDEIDQLRKELRLLQQSNTHYEQETRLLKSQIQSLKCRNEIPAARDLNRDFDTFKSEVLDEVNKLRQEFGSVCNNSFNEKEMHFFRKDLDKSEQRHTQDMRELKNDIENIRNRLVKVEIESKSVMADCKDCLRKCQRLSSDASNFSEAMRYQSKATSSQLQSLNDSCAHLSILRNSLSDLEERISSLEDPGSRQLYSPSDSKRSSAGQTRGSSYVSDKLLRSRELPKNETSDNLDISLDLSLLSDEVTTDKSLDVSDVSTYKLGSMAESVTGSLDLITDSMLSDDD